ncbi:class I SAM-dependent methyltransferase [Paenibacillus sp. NEAU-GSW1]|uniref:class I SAM-dependent DNA methyltransferase n=1 Tax=Paenibacillus sp. NEAU-GSW1 TaxID=2682486 RepID=UPI0012E30FA6|nr:class I SAM-dependent methyltransferase [Paenibacillus sp. NEAU-GSW1]MUT66276.1 methyltransferase domain-containing protein [Paenibacillus sp. NEAU-GSW1]
MDAYGQFASVYDRLMADMPYDKWRQFAESCWARYGEPSTVVDLGCGTGSIAIPLALSGRSVYGIDLSADMLAVASSKWDDRRSASIARGGSIVWLQQDMRDWQLAEPADCVISFCDCINYLTEEEDVESAFRAAHEGLKEDGLFMFDVHAPSVLERYAEGQPFVLDEEEVAYIWTCEFDEERCEIEHQLTIFAQEQGERFRRFEELHTQRAYDPDWIKAALLRAGFSAVELFADFELQPADSDSERLFFVARR